MEQVHCIPCWERSRKRLLEHTTEVLEHTTAVLAHSDAVLEHTTGQVPEHKQVQPARRKTHGDLHIRKHREIRIQMKNRMIRIRNCGWVLGRCIWLVLVPCSWSQKSGWMILERRRRFRFRGRWR